MYSSDDVVIAFLYNDQLFFEFVSYYNLNIVSLFVLQIEDC